MDASGSPKLDASALPGFETGLETTRLKRTIAEQAAELQEYKHRCERIQRFLSTRPEEVRRLGEAELVDVIERDKKLCELERRLRAREESIERQQAELDRVHASRAADLDSRSGALDREQRDLAARQKTLEERVLKEKAALRAELDQWRGSAESALARELETSKRAKEAAENVKLLQNKLSIVELEVSSLRDRLEDWGRKAKDIETSRQELRSERELLAAFEASLGAREKALEERAAHLESDHAQRRQTLDSLKQQMRLEIAELTRQYRRQDQERA